MYTTLSDASDYDQTALAGRLRFEQAVISRKRVSMGADNTLKYMLKLLFSSPGNHPGEIAPLFPASPISIRLGETCHTIFPLSAPPGDDPQQR